MFLKSMKRKPACADSFIRQISFVKSFAKGILSLGNIGKCRLSSIFMSLVHAVTLKKGYSFTTRFK